MEDFSRYLRLQNNCDSDDPLLSTTSLGSALERVSLNDVDKKDLLELAQALNLKQLIPTSTGYPRDYRGIAELMGFSTVEIETQMNHSHNPMSILIDKYIVKNRFQDGSPFVNDLLKLIERIERFDVIDDFIPTLIRLASTNNQVAKQAGQLRLIQNGGNPISSCELQNKTHPKQTYDAFISFAPEDDLYAQEIIDMLYNNGRSIVTADHVLPGQFEHDGLIELIERCKKVVIILTPNFTHSKECAFQANVASEVSIKTGKHMIIPVLCEPCVETLIPNKIRMLSKIDLTNKRSRQWQLTKLIPSIGSREASVNSFEHDSRLLDAKRNQPALVIDGDFQVPAIKHDMEIQSRDDGTPIIEPFYSQSSGAIDDASHACNILTINESEMLTRGSSPRSSSNKPLDKIKRWFSRSPASSGTSSQANLLMSDTHLDGKSDNMDNDR